MNRLQFTIRGVTALLMHSDRLADPLDPDAKRLKTLTSKRSKTDQDHEDIRYEDWAGGLYWNEKIGPYVPGQNIKACMVGAGKIHKLGTAVKRGVTVTNMECPLRYEGPRDKKTLYEEGYSDTRTVVVSQSRLMRTRPMFPEWELDFQVSYSDKLVSEDQFLNLLGEAGELIGLCDFRPDKGGLFGKFEVIKSEVIA